MGKIGHLHCQRNLKKRIFFKENKNKLKTSYESINAFFFAGSWIILRFASGKKLQGMKLKEHITYLTAEKM